MYTPNRENLAWAAGFFDGEGSFTKHNNKARDPLVFVAQSDLEPLEKFKMCVGFGRINGPYPAYYRGGRVKDRWQYCLFGFEKVQATAAFLWPFLSRAKKEQAKRILKGYKPRIKKIDVCEKSRHRIWRSKNPKTGRTIRRCLDCLATWKRENAARKRVGKVRNES